MNKIFLIVFALFVTISANALEIIRYVSQGASGDGLTKESPTGDLKKVLDLSRNVDGLTIYLEPGTYNLPPLSDINNRTKYNNVTIWGGGCSGIYNTENKSVINGDLYINGGAVLNIDFKGSRIEDQWSPNVIEGSLHLIGCNIFYSNASALEVETVNGNDLSLIEVTAKSLSIHPWRTGSAKSNVHLLNCKFDMGQGASFSGVRLNAVNCSFSQNVDATGISLNNCEGSVLSRCSIIGNHGFGGVTINDLTDNIDVVLDGCIISENVSTRGDYSSAITTRSPILLKSCLVAGNHSILKMKGASYYNQHKGAIELCRTGSRFENCTFVNNKDAVIYYSMSIGDHNRISFPTFTNCVFLNNGKPYISTCEKSPIMSYCAADFSSDIPELDAERHMLRITEQTAGIIINNNVEVKLQDGSPLINVGLPTANLDLNGNCHLMLGGTDLGCVEYTGEWVKSDSQQEIRFGDMDYTMMETTYKNRKYFTYMPASTLDKRDTVTIKNCIYTGNNIANCLVKDNKVIATYMNLADSRIALLYQLNSSRWETNQYLTLSYSLPYSTTLPKPENINDKWILKIPAVPKATTKSANGKTTGSPKRFTTTKRTTTTKKNR